MTTPAAAVTPNSAPVTPPRVVPSEVGWQFVPQYYTFVNKQPSLLHCFYTKTSTFIHGTEGEDGKPCHGQHEIHSKILSIGFQDCKVFIHSVDAQSSANGGIIIQVIGEMSNKGEPWRKFAQTFFLAEQPTGYFVLNDIFRFLREEEPADEEEEEGETEVQEHTEAVTFDAPAPQLDAAPEPEPLVAVDEPIVASEPAPVVEASEPEPVAQPYLAPATTNGVNGSHEEAEAALDSPVAEPAVAIPVEPETVAEQEAPAPVETASIVAIPTPPRTVSPTPEPIVAAPVVAAEKPVEKKPVVEAAAPPPAQTPAAPPKPAAPKTWASLAAVKSTSWGANLAADSKGVSTAAAPSSPAPVAPKPRPSSVIAPAAPQQENANGDKSPAYHAALAITTPQCFVKSVTENVAQPVLRDLLTSRFGPIKELDIVRSKACAFLEFTTVESARRAIIASLPVSLGGEGGIWVAEGDTTALIHNRDVPRITVETRKERGDRPPSRPRGGAPPTGEGRGAYRGGAGGPGRGRGGALRGAAPAGGK